MKGIFNNGLFRKIFFRENSDCTNASVCMIDLPLSSASRSFFKRVEHVFFPVSGYSAKFTTGSDLSQI